MMSRQNLVNGNTVLVPEYQPISPEKKQEYERLKKAKLENQQKKKQKSVESKAKVLRNILIVFAMGIILIYRYSTIYNMQKELTSIKNQATALHKENENLNVELLKVSNIEHVKQVAEEKLKMVSANKNQVIYSDLSHNNFTDTLDENNNKTQANLMEKIKNMLF